MQVVAASDHTVPRHGSTIQKARFEAATRPKLREMDEEADVCDLLHVVSTDKAAVCYTLLASIRGAAAKA
eukprot:10975-Eustigmatos_ZCMA.PRE.1